MAPNGDSDLEHLSDWIGKTEHAEENLARFPLAGLTALLDYETPPWNEGELPPLARRAAQMIRCIRALRPDLSWIQ